MHTVRQDPDLKRFYRRKLQQKGFGKARVAAARKLGARLYIMLRDRIDLPRVLPPRTAAAERWCPCGNAWPVIWSCDAVTGILIRLPASPSRGEFG